MKYMAVEPLGEQPTHDIRLTMERLGGAEFVDVTFFFQAALFAKQTYNEMLPTFTFRCIFDEKRSPRFDPGGLEPCL